MKSPSVSIVIPTRNGGSRLRHVLDAIRDQQYVPRPELVIVDSGSTDLPCSELASLADVFVEIAPDAFNHGKARNQGAARSSGEIVVMLVQDAVPRGRDWLASLVGPFADDASVVGVFARQVPRADASPLTRRQLAGWVAGETQARVVRVAGRDAYEALTPMARLRLCAFDNVCAALRRSAWQQRPFALMPIAEDLAWGRDTLLAGDALAYAPQAVVEHSHDRSAWYELKRTWVLHQQLHRLFGVRTIPSVGHLARAIASTSQAHARWVRDETGTGISNHVRGQTLAVAWPLGQYLGGLTAAIGRPQWRPAGV